MKRLYVLSFIVLFSTTMALPVHAEFNSLCLATPLSKFQETINIIPISHASFILKTNNLTIYIDPVGGDIYKTYSAPDLILITDIHGDHLNVETLQNICLSKTSIYAPKAVIDKLPEALKKQSVLIENGKEKAINNLTIEGIPMYNLRPEALKFHEKGRGNGYVLTLNGKRIYISGDTEDIPEMRHLQNIDMAFVCMNLPYTMTVDKAADAVLEFKPKEVYPYHYRGTDGFSDVNRFKSLIEKNNNNIKVNLLDWYSKN